jgi:hypothetical protein
VEKLHLFKINNTDVGVCSAQNKKKEHKWVKEVSKEMCKSERWGLSKSMYNRNSVRN